MGDESRHVSRHPPEAVTKRHTAQMLRSMREVWQQSLLLCVSRLEADSVLFLELVEHRQRKAAA